MRAVLLTGMPDAWQSLVRQRNTKHRYIAKMQYMKAVQVARAKEVRDDGSIVEIIIWELPEPLPPSTHRSSTGCSSASPVLPACATTTSEAKAIIVT